MAYELAWGSANPGHIVYLLDLSGSMKRELNGQRLVDVVMTAIYQNLSDLVALNTKGDVIFERFTCTVIGYNSDVVKLIDNASVNKTFDYVLDAEANGMMFDTNSGGIAEPRWQTYMADAFAMAADDVKAWIVKQKAKGLAMPAPVVINITDGFPEEKGLTREQAVEKALKAAGELKRISTPDGDLLLYNIHITPDKAASTLALPNAEPKSTDMKFLYEASSVIPQKMIDQAKRIWKEADIDGRSHLMVSNESDPTNIQKFINFASQSQTNNGPTETAKPG